MLRAAWDALMLTISRMGVWDVLDILIIALCIYWILRVTRETRAMQLLKGMGVVLILSRVASYLQLQTVAWVLDYTIRWAVVILAVLFQPELRRALEHIGRGKYIPTSRRHEQLDQESFERFRAQLISVVMRLSRRNVGALIVIERKNPLGDIAQSGARIDALVSAPLIENIFEPDTPLHDGAILIRENRILAAGCILPLTESTELSLELGTRHRAAIGVSEMSDAVALVVSEETGAVSFALGGKLTRHLDQTSLHRVITQYCYDEEESGSFWDKLFKKKVKHAG